MPTGGSARRYLLVDTSVAVALVVGDHPHHEATSRALAGHQLGLAGHAAFETFSVLSRLPPPARRRPAMLARVLAQGFPCSRFLSGGASESLIARLGASGIAGGSVYDALVGATACEHGLALVSRDRRALETYRRIGVEVELIG